MSVANVPVLKDQKLIDLFLERGTDKIYPSPSALKKKLLSGERIKVYQGFDPSGPHLHVGHAIGIRALRILQQLGHEVIFLVGDYTAKVGDPDKETTRKMLTDEEIEKNMAGWKTQAAQLIDFSGKNPVSFERNYHWLSHLKMEDTIKLMSNITVQRMLERDLFEKRIKNNEPLYLHEFIYPLLQGYDGVAMKVDLEIGGSDQTFNMLVGRELVKSYLGKEKFVRTNRMMEAADGRTMSKTKGNGINLADSPKEMYGKAMAYPDSLIITGLELLTELTPAEIKECEQAIKNGTNPMEIKKKLAFEIVRLIKGSTEATEAEQAFIKTFSLRETPTDIPKIKAGNEMVILEILKTCLKNEYSGSQLRKLITEGAVRLDGEKIQDLNQKITVKKGGAELKVGKRKWFRLVN
jgi:tyrosyl-tRNA synthetase